MRYEDYITAKHRSASAEPCPRAGDIAPHLFPFQRALTDWALRRGRAALFADTGLGKTAMQIEWARHVATAGRVLILSPLAVAQQTIREAARFGVTVEYARRPDQSAAPIVITNYDLLEHFAGERWTGIVLDESSILKSYDGATRNAILGAFSQTPFRLACTATPAPNDYTELGNHAEFLGVKSRVEMLAEYFCHDGGETQTWRLKGHAVDHFWRWVCGWGAMAKRPSDICGSDDGFALPPLRMHEHTIQIEHEDAWKEGYLFAPDVRTLSDQRATRRATMEKRIAKVAELATGSDPVLVWCELNDEADGCAAAIPGAVQVRGSDDPDDKTDRLLGFAAGKYRVLVTKPSIAGFGMNWQICSRVIFVGASHSYEQTYQAIRRCWRFGQTRPVDVHILRAETEGAIVANYLRKEADAERMAAELVGLTRDHMRTSIGAAHRETNAYEPSVRMTVPAWAGVEAT